MVCVHTTDSIAATPEVGSGHGLMRMKSSGRVFPKKEPCCTVLLGFEETVRYGFSVLGCRLERWRSACEVMPLRATLPQGGMP